MSEREAAAEAARAAGREKATFEVIGRPLVRNGRRLSVGTRLKLSRADAEILASVDRIKPAAKGKKGDVVVDDELADAPNPAPGDEPAPPTVGEDGAATGAP